MHNHRELVLTRGPLYVWSSWGMLLVCASFSFLYLKKIKISKIYVRFENFRKWPTVARPSNGRQDLNVIFFEFAKRSLAGGVWREGSCRPPQRAIGGLPSYISPGLHSLLIWAQKLHQKFRKKERGEERKAAKLYRIPHLWSTGNFCMNPLILYNNLI